MEHETAIDALSSLAHATRLSVFRLLVQTGADGLPAGEIARRVGAAPSTLSHHLALLERAHLLTSRRVQRQIFYAADYAGSRALLAYLMQDCCQGRTEICGDLLAACA